MVTKFKISTILSIVAIITLCATCKKDECIGNSYSLKASWSVSPGIDSISIGDTIEITSAFPNHPFDYNSNKTVDFNGGAKVSTTFGVVVLRPGSINGMPAVDSFKFIPVTGSISPNPTNSDHIREAVHVETINEYRLNFKMVALKKGIYLLVLSDGLASKSGDCGDKAGILYTNNNANNHIYFEEQFYGTTNTPASDRTHTYCFKVK